MFVAFSLFHRRLGVWLLVISYWYLVMGDWSKVLDDQWFCWKTPIFQKAGSKKQGLSTAKFAQNPSFQQNHQSPVTTHQSDLLEPDSGRSEIDVLRSAENIAIVT